jgi:ribosomal-protein-alanine N-acetyltransferase
LDEIIKIEKETFPIPWSSDSFMFRHKVEPKFFLVAVTGDKVVAYTVGSIVSKGQSVGHIMNLAVMKTMRRQGIGSLMLGRLEDMFREAKILTVYLEARVSNSNAVRLYKSRGYQKVKKLQRYYHDEDGILMAKHIS